MNQYERLKENRRDYRRNFFLGLLGGHGLVSAILWALNGRFNRNDSDSTVPKTLNNRSPDQFETIYKNEEKK